MKRWLPPAGLAILFGVLYLSVLRDLIYVWWEDPNYSHGLLIPFVAAYLVWDKKAVLGGLTARPVGWGMVVLGMGLLLRVFGTMAETIGAGYAGLFTNGTSLIVVLVGGVLLFLGKSYFKALFFPLAYLVFMVPLPGYFFSMVTVPLQNYATRVTTNSLQLFGIPVLREGNIITLPAMTMGVVEACSGIRSLFSLLALAGAIALIFMAGQPLWKRVCVFASSIPIAIITNAFRVTATGFMSHFWGPEVAQGFYHDFSGWMIFLAAFILLSIEVFILNKIQPAERKEVA